MAIGPALETGLRRAVLLTTFALPCLLGFMTSYLLGLLSLAALLWMLALWRWQPPRLDIAGAGFLLAFAVLLTLFTLTAQAPEDIGYAFNFTAFLLFVPLATLFWRGRGEGASLVLAKLSLLGVALGTVLALVDKFALGARRSGELTSDPIRLADTALILGFLSLIGLLAEPARRRWIYLLGPLLALITVFLSGSRGALFAAPAMLVVAVFGLVPRKRVATVTGVGLLVSLVGLVAVADRLGGSRSSTLLTIFRSFAAGDAVADRTLGIRVELYRAAYAAFWEAPLLGHGWARLMSAPRPYLPRGFRKHANLPHLHNDLLNFAVSGGAVGVVLYLMLLALPIVAVLRTRRDSQFRIRVYGAVLLVVSYVFLGTPDTMVSFELHTALYVAMTAALLHYCRDRGEGAVPT